MTDPIDRALYRLRGHGSEYRLDGLERDVARRIAAQEAEEPGGYPWQLQLAVTCGSLLIGVLRNGLNLMNVESYVQQVIVGIVILLAVMMDRLRK